jgi:hypothetical protein
VTGNAVGEAWLGPRALTALVAGSLLLSQTAGGLYAAIERPLPELVSVLGNLLVSLSVIAWFRAYSRARSISGVFDMDTFLLSLWFVLVPYYVVRREGWRGVGRVALFALAYVAAGVVGGLVPPIALALTASG